MMEYDGDLHVPAQYLVTPPARQDYCRIPVCIEGEAVLHQRDTEIWSRHLLLQWQQEREV
jgi:hypothetical protein